MSEEHEFLKAYVNLYEVCLAGYAFYGTPITTTTTLIKQTDFFASIERYLFLKIFLF